MSGLIRNAPCPCGSGKKYKQCCLRRHEDEAARQRHRYQGLEAALDWVEQRHPKEYEAAVVEGYFASFGDEEQERIAHLGAREQEMIDLNVGEWLLADGTLELEEGGEKVERRVADLVLGAEGATLTADQRALIEALRDEPLRLYERVDDAPGATLTLRDALEPSESLTLADPDLSDAFEPGEYLGLRLITSDGVRESSGAVYGFSADAGAEVLGRLREELEAFAADASAEDAWLRRRTVSEVIIDRWLAGMTGSVAS